MKAISLTRPWTELVLAGVKDVENRTWPTRHRGWLIVHGARSYDPAALELVTALGQDGRLTSTDYANLDSCAMHPDTADTGYLGLIRITHCHRAGELACYQRGQDRHSGNDLCSPWAFDRQWHWTIAECLRFAVPIPGPGRLQLFDPPLNVSDEIERICPGILGG